MSPARTAGPGPRAAAVVWPGRAALAQALRDQAADAPGGLLLTPPYFTFETLLPSLLEQCPLPAGARPLLPLAGPLLVQGLLAEGADGDLFSGLALGRRLPERLWRLLVELKAARLTPAALNDLAGPGRPRLGALARLLASYDEALDRRGLVDQADRLAIFEKRLKKGLVPPLMAGWNSLTARMVLTLRPLDMRLLLALSEVLPLVRVEFAYSPDDRGADPLRGLMEFTASALEREGGAGLELVWSGEAVCDGSLAALAGAGDVGPAEAARVEIVCAAGRYSEAEEMVRRALLLVRDGVDPADIAIIAPELDLFGPMARDAAARMGLPLAAGESLPLSACPPARALLALLELPLAGWERGRLARVLGSRYLAPALARRAGGGGAGAVLARAGRLIAGAGYVDGAERPASRALAEAAGQSRGNGRDLAKLSKACEWVEYIIKLIYKEKSLSYYCKSIIDAMDALGLAGARPEPGAPARVAARDAAACREMAARLEDLAAAAEQAGEARPLSPGRRLALVREALGRARLRLGPAQPWGVRLLTPAQAFGLAPHTVLIAGLCQGGFPRRPAGRGLLSSGEMKALGGRARLAVWRTDEEEYAGQVSRLLGLLGRVRESAVLGFAAADGAGRPQRPAFVLQELAGRLGAVIPGPSGGVFGRLPELDQAMEPLALWGRLASGLLRPAAGPDPLAKAVLHRLATEPEAARRWRDLAGRALAEQGREALDELGDAERPERSDGFSGRLDPALLGPVLADPGQRRLSPSRLETYAACPMRYFFRYLIGLRAVEEPGWELERSQEGQVVHDALAAYFKPGDYAPGLTPDERRRRLDGCLDAAMQRAGHGHPRLLAVRRTVLEPALWRVTEREEAALAGAGLVPVAVEQPLGGDDEGLAVALAGGGELRLAGRLDRLDLEDELVRVTDYKHSKDDTLMRRGANRELAGDSQFQLAVYLAEARRLHGPLAAMGRIVPTRLPELGPWEMEFAPGDAYLDGSAQVRTQCAAEGEPNIFNQIEALWLRLAGGDFTPRPQGGPCKFCEFAGLCRARDLAAADEEGD